MDVNLETLLLGVVTCLLAALVWLLWNQSPNRQQVEGKQGPPANAKQGAPKIPTAPIDAKQDAPKIPTAPIDYENVPVDHRVISIVQKTIGKSWLDLGREMEISEEDLETISKDYEAQGIKEMAYQVFRTWQQQNPREATVGVLVQHLVAIKRKDLADRILKIPVNQERSNFSSLFQPVSNTGISNGSQFHRRNPFEYVPAFQYQPPSQYYPRPEGGGRQVMKGQTVHGGTGDINIRTQKLYQPAETTDSRTLRERRNQLLTQRHTSLKMRYQALTMKGLPWMTGYVLSLDEYYVELGMIRKDSRGKDLPSEPMNIADMFKPVEKSNTAEVPSRILIEGGPGFGKTTIASKLCFDWCKSECYIQHFHFVLFLPLRHFSGDLEGAFVKALIGNTEVQSEDREIMLSALRDDKVRILTILDGFDELPKKQEGIVLSLLRSEILPHMTVILTSRPGKLTSNKNDNDSLYDDVGLDMNKLIHKRISIVGISEQMQAVFVKKHTANFDHATRNVVTENLKELTKHKMITVDFLKCPLFLLMIILLLTKTENLEHAFETRTELYKDVFNFVIQRYCIRKGDKLQTTPNLFIFEADQIPVHVNLCANLGTLAVCVLKVDALSFTHEDILETEHNIDPEIFELGFLSQNVSVEGIGERIIYEPVHKSLLEFAAAYGLWVSFKTQPLDHWKKQIMEVRPNDESAANSLLFPFLAGLMEENSVFLFDALKTHASYYCTSFDSLVLTLLEVQRTESITTSLIPLLPLRWNIPWLNGNDNGFSQSLQHGVCLHYGISNGKIKTVTWNCEHPFRFPDDVEVEILYMELRGSVTRLNVAEYEGFRCKHVRCTVFAPPSDMHVRRLYDDRWENVLHFLTQITFQSISFNFILSPAIWLMILHKSLTSGNFKHVNIHRLNCILYERQHHNLNLLCDLLNKDRIQTMYLEISSMSTIFEMHNQSKPEHKSLSPLCDDQCQGRTCNILTQPDIDCFIECAAKSVYMNSLIIKSYETASPLIIDMVTLCNVGHKSWNSLSFDGIQIICTNVFEYECQIRHLDFTEAIITTTTMNLFHKCRVSSLVCKTEFLIQAVDRDSQFGQLSELTIPLDDSVSHPCFEATLNKLANLSILIITMTKPQYKCETETRNWLLKLLNDTSLRRLEFWYVAKNLECTLQLLDALVVCYTGNKVIHLPLNCLLLHMNLDPDHSKQSNEDNVMVAPLPSKQSNEDNEMVAPLISAIINLKPCMQNQSLTCLEIACSSSVPLYMENVKPENISSWADIFSSEDGFCIERDLLGSKESDSTYSKERYNSANNTERFSITFRK